MTSFNPQTAPIQELAGEIAVDPTRLNVNWIKNRFAAPPVWHTEATDEHRLIAARHGDFRKAAVLVALLQRKDGLHVLFTRRTAHLSQHAGQISFPGGRSETHDHDAIDTALRESEEEIGLDKSAVEILGLLPEYFTITGYCVTPVVAAIKDPPSLSSDPNEVAEIFEVPLAFLMDGQHHQRRTIVMSPPGQEPQQRTFYAMPYQDHFIWGATAGMLRNLFHLLRA
jgi:8-oxo-dGTP pyrophosphatase MutT (NUDIX family)